MANLLSDDDVFGAGSNSLLSDGDVFGGKPEKKQNKGIAGDLATDLKRGVQGLPGVLTGIGDMIVAPIVGDAVVGKGWDLVGKKTGFQPSKWAKDAGEEYSPSRQAENASINKAWEDNSTPFGDAASGDFSGIGGIAKAYVQNPMATAGNVVESIPSMALGGLFGKGLGVASKMSPIVSGAIGEGAVMGGQQMTNLTDSGVDGRTASAASWGTAAGGAFVGGASGRIAKAAGLADIDTALAGGAVRGVSTEAADKTIRGSIKEAAKRVSGGAATEGLLEELPQSVLEQTLSNLAQGKPWSEGVARSAVEGTLAGSLMGGAFNALPGKKEDAQTNPPSADALPEIAGLLPAPTYTGTPGDQLVSADAERQASIDAAESANAKPWEERDAYENLKQDLAKNNVTITTDPAPIQQRIDALMGINENRLTGRARSNYEKALDIAFNEQIGVVVGENSLEVPFTMGDYLKSKVAAADITRDRPKAESANQQAVDRLGQLNNEESQHQPDIPVVGVLSRIANAGIRSGAIRRDQTVPVVPPAIQSTPVSNNLSPTQQIDLSQRTDGQLSYLSNKGRPGLREAAIAEIQRRGQTNAAKAQPLAQEATQANDAQAGIEQAAAQNAEVARSPQAQQGTDSPVQQSPTTPSIPPEIVSRVAKRTDKELAFMVKANRDPVVREAVAKEIAIRAADQNKIDAVSQSKPDAAPVKSEQPQPAKGSENGQAETEVLNLPGAVKDAEPVKPNVLREARDRRKAKESLPANDAGLIEPVPDLSESSRQALYESLKSRMLKGEVTLQYGQRQLAAFDEAVKARDEAMQDTADGNPSEEKPSQPKTDTDPEAKQEQATASTEEKSDSGTVDRSKWSIGKYRHAKDSVVLAITEPDGYKGRLARISEAIGARYVGRANGYVTSEKKARKAIDLAGKGWDASSFNGELTEPTDEKSKNSDEAVNATVDAGNDEKSEFVKAPDGSIDFGEITKEMSNAMRRQPGKIRLEKGDDSYGEQHIESRRGNQIRGMGFKSIAAFVSDAVKHIESIWKPSKTSQMVLIQATENGKAVFIELKQSDSGDFYTVNTAFPIGSSYTNNKDKWSLLWSGASVPTVASGANPLAESSPNAGVTTTMTPGQSSNSSVAKSEPESKIEDFGKKLYNIADDNSQLAEESAAWASIVSDFFAGKISKTETPTVLRNTPAVLQALGLPDYEIKISLAHGVEYAMYNHGIKPSQLKAIPNLMTDPQAVFVNKGADGKYSLNVLTGITVNGRQVAIALQPSKHGMAPGKVHFIATITPRENGVFAKMAENGFLVYAGKDMPQDISTGLRKATMKYGQSAIDLKALMASKFDSTARTSKIIYRSDVVNLIESGEAKYASTKAQSITPADKAIYSMAAEGKSAADVLKFISSASRSPFNRMVAKLLLKTGINPTITVGDGKGWKMNAGEGHKYAAAYNPETNTVALFRPANAERHALHELIHASSVKALGKKGLAAIQMRALYSHVQRNGKSVGLFYDAKTKRGIYGMANIDEFIAEAFSNPKFQALLKQVSAPISGGKPTSAWQWFVRVIRGILGMSQGQDNALSRVLEIGVDVMREDVAIRRVDNAMETAGIAERNDAVNRMIEQWADGDLEAGTVLSLGKPSAILRRFGVPDYPIQIEQGVLTKAVVEKHDVSVADLKDITINIQAPIAVFKAKSGDGKIVVVTEIRHRDGNVIAALRLGTKRNRVEINDIRSIHPKRDASIAHWVDDGLLLGLDKHKGRDWLENSARSNSGQYPVNATPDGLILYDGRLIRKAAETAVIRYAEGQKQTDATNPDIRYNVADDGWAELTGAKERIVGDSGRDYNDKQRQFFKNVGRDVSRKNIIGKTVDYLRSDFWKKMAVGIVDQFRGLRDLDDGGQAYMLARLSKGTAGAFDALLHHGKLSLKDGVYDSDTSGGFVDRLGVQLHGELDDALWWIAANRAESLSAQGKENLFSPEDIAAGKSLASGTTEFDYTIQTGLSKGKVTRNRAMIYADANRVFNEFQKNTLDIAEQSGLIDGSTRKFWESEFYVPFYRVSEEDGEFIGAKMGNALVRQQAFKKLKGGADKLNSDLLSNTLLNWSHLIEASAKNRAAKAALTAAEKVGAAHKATPGEKKTVWHMDRGQKVEYGVDDPFVMTAITSLEYAGMRNAVMDVLTSFKHWLTIGVTASPAFKVRNLIRDSVQAIGTSDLGYNPIKNVTEGFKQTKRDSQEYVSALASGGLIRFGTMLEGSESSRVRQLIKSGVKDSSILDSEPKWRQLYDKYLEPGISAYNELGNRSEEINRAALYNQLIKQGKSHAEAALLARDLMDFSMQGSFNTIRFLTQVVPFLNARLQGLYKLGRAAKDDPRKMAVVTGAVAMASIALMLGYDDDEDWKRREDWDRDNFWWFKLGGIEYRIPKPFEIGAVATMAERSLEYMINDEMTGERFTKVMKDLVMNQLSMNPVPQAVKPIIDLYANKDSHTGRPIESMGMQRLDKDMRFNSSTSMVGRGLGSSIGILSPVQYDHLARAYFGWLGSFAVGTADMAIRAANDEPTKPTRDYWKFATQGILKEEGTGNSRYLSQLYEQAKELESAHATYRQLIKDGKIGDAQEYAEDNKEKLARYRQVERVKNIETKFNERIREIERSDIDSDQKKERINNINKMKEAAARRLSPGVQGP